MAALAGAGAALAWFGTSILVLAEARRGVALGLGVAAVGLGLVALAQGPAPGAAIAGGGLLAAGFRLRDGGRGWGVLPPGSTPRLVLSVAVLLLAALVGGSLMTGPGAAARVAALAVAGLAGARLLTTARRGAALGAAAALALALGVVAPEAGAWVAGLVAAVLGAIPADEAQEVTA